jgi:hypothetical protein
MKQQQKKKLTNRVNSSISNIFRKFDCSSQLFDCNSQFIWLWETNIVFNGQFVYFEIKIGQIVNFCLRWTNYLTATVKYLTGGDKYLSSPVNICLRWTIHLTAIVKYLTATAKYLSAAVK